MRTGDGVSWNTSQGTTHGTIVESAKTGAKAAHRESALEPRRGGDA